MQFESDTSDQNHCNIMRILYCIYCGKPLDKPNKKFCNNSCAAKFNNKKRFEQGYTTKGKTKKALCNKCGNEFEISIHANSENYLCDDCKPTKPTITTTTKKSGKYIVVKYRCICKICGNEFYSRHKNACHCSHKCSNNDPATKEKLRQKQYKLIEEGKHQGWQSRNIRSYPEKFWKDVLDNNGVIYQQEVYIKEYQYFLDFLIETPQGKIDLEIDGSQHNKPDAKYKDKIRDERLTNMGYIIYRIPWNEINTEFGKSLMKDKIDQFLKFMESI